MGKLPKEINWQFAMFVNGQIPVADFEQWVYTSPDLEDVLSKSDYIDLLSVNYKTKHSEYDVKSIILKYINFAEYETQKLKELLTRTIEEDKNLPDILRDFYHLYCMGYRFLDNLGLGYGLLIEAPPSTSYSGTWEDLSAESQNALLQSILPGAIEEAKKVLGWLEQERITLTNEKGEYNLCKFEDRRSDIEKQPTSYKQVIIDTNHNN